jgi:hypothetical protein
VIMRFFTAGSISPGFDCNIDGVELGRGCANVVTAT